VERQIPKLTTAYRGVSCDSSPELPGNSCEKHRDRDTKLMTADARAVKQTTVS